MNDLIQTTNHGPLIAASTYWASDYARAGYYYLTPNAGVLRLLVPPLKSADVAEMRTAREIIVRRGADDRHGGRLMTEIMFDDRTQSPFVLYLSEEQWERLPAEDDYPRPIEFTVWEDRRGTPHKVLGRPGWLALSQLPSLKPWPKSND